ncbi:hypothetical protein BT63DRAFT_422861 [Microthyrium microscopicum]|uniref:ATPase synthesis protein 25 n=1 Tax=Microthyrium microscopicum TaxID=703497 RepID=A0A6A6ULQ7_9PEZI|nr:hypothetical protein BT63DRAFT_422861 [Microthyrium microscopicum]
MSFSGPVRSICRNFRQQRFISSTSPAWYPRARPAYRQKSQEPVKNQFQDPLQRLEDLGTDIVEEIQVSKPATTAQTAPSIPWYLQDQLTTTKPEQPDHVVARQQIPTLPQDPPPLLEPLLEYISTDLGMDYLTLVDLRQLDPPAALGSNVIMAFGTARGEKHLHVSADRACRWLRSQHKLRPRADGLLGRGELKLKLRRRAKKLRIMAHVGSAETPDMDDGIRTGWVCVSIPGVKSADGTSRDEPVQQGFVGFGESSNDVQIVLQLMTEGKREDLSLEQYWSARLKRQMIREEKEGIKWHDFDEEVRDERTQWVG